MTDYTHDVGLLPLVVEGVAHPLAVDGKTFVGLARGCIPALQGAVERLGIDADEDITQDVFARHEVASGFMAAAEPLARLLSAQSRWPCNRTCRTG